MTYSKTFTSTITTIGIILSVYVAGLSTSIITRQSTTSHGWVTHTQLVTRQIQQVYTLPFELENEKRGYILTNKDFFLKSYDATKESIDLHLKVLSSLIRDNPQQGDNLLRLQSVIAEKIALFDRVINTRKQKGAEAAATLIFDVEEKNLELIRKTKRITDDMIRVEDNLLAVRERKSQWQFYQLAFSMMFLILRDVIWCGYQMKLMQEAKSPEGLNSATSA